MDPERPRGEKCAVHLPADPLGDKYHLMPVEAAAATHATITCTDTSLTSS